MQLACVQGTEQDQYFVQAAEASKQAKPGNDPAARVVSRRKSDALERSKTKRGKKAASKTPESTAAKIADFSKSAEVFRHLQEQRSRT